jgi:hypothetical protein
MGAIKPPSSSLLGFCQALIQRVSPSSASTQVPVAGSAKTSSVHDYVTARAAANKNKPYITTSDVPG